MMERSVLEERRRERERNIMQEGKALWLQKKQEQLEVELREQEDVSIVLHLLFTFPETIYTMCLRTCIVVP